MVKPIMIFVATGVLAVSTVACRGDAICDLPHQEPLNPASGVHLVDASEVVWTTDPPTSGPHRSISPTGGIHGESIPRLDQIAFLEVGGVILHHRPQMPPVELEKLRRLANPNVLIAPNLASDFTNPVIATAWGWKLKCRAVDMNALIEFVNSRVQPERRPH